MKRLFLLLFFTIPAYAQVNIPYNGTAPYSGSMSVNVVVTQLPSGCTQGTPSYANGTITVPLNCGVIPPPVVTNCASASTPLTGCAIGNSVATVNTPGNIRGTPTASGGNGPLLGTVAAGAVGVVMSNPIPQSTPGKGWQVINYGAAGSCNAAGPYSATCGFQGNDNLAPSGVTPPPVTTCAQVLKPSGGQDNAALLAAINAAAGKCVELTPGTYSLSAWTPPANASLLLDDAVVIQDFGIFGQFTPFFSISNPVSIVGKGPLYSAVVTMPTNYANAKVQVGKGLDYEYQHGFSLLNGVSGVVLSNFSIVNAAGDGLNFNNTTGATITNVNSATNIRQGYSITGPSTGWTITGGLLHDGPLSGFDIEPAKAGGNFQGTITNLATKNNIGGGTSFGMMNLDSTSSINIVANGLTSTNDGGTGIAYWNGSNTVAPTGTVTCNNCSVTGSGADGSYGQRSNVGYLMVFNNLSVTNSNSKQSSGTNQTNTALGLQCNSCTGASPGGVQWNNVTITGGNGCFSVPSNAVNVKISGSCNGKAISLNQ